MARLNLSKEQNAQIQNININLDLKTHFVTKKQTNGAFLLENDWINIDKSVEYKKILYKYTPVYRIESFFCNLFSYILKKDYSSDFFRKYREGLLFRFQMVSEKILFDEASILFNESFIKENNFDIKFEWDERYQLYGKHFKYIIDDILSLVNYDKENKIKKFIEIDENENPFFSQNANFFVQQLAIIGYSLATNRILDNFDNDNYFGLEIMDYNENSDLIIHLTPLGMMECLDRFTKLNPEQRKVEFEKQLNKIGVQIIDNKGLKSLLQTSVILAFNNDVFKHYKTNEISASQSLSGRTNREHISSVVVETQSNYIKLKNNEVL